MYYHDYRPTLVVNHDAPILSPKRSRKCGCERRRKHTLVFPGLDYTIVIC